MIIPVAVDIDLYSASSSYMMAEHRESTAPKHGELFDPRTLSSYPDLYEFDLKLSYDTTHWQQTPKPEYFMSEDEQMLVTEALMSSVQIIHE